MVVLVMVTEPKSLAIPPPPLATFPEMTVSVMVVTLLLATLATAPPLAVAELRFKVLLEMLTEPPLLQTAPPSRDKFPVRLELKMLNVPALYMAPPSLPEQPVKVV